MPNPKEVIETDRKSRTPKTRLGAWYSDLTDEEKDWFWDIMEDAYFDGEYGALAALDLVRPYLDAVPDIGPGAGKKFLDEQRPARQERTPSGSKGKRS